VLAVVALPHGLSRSLVLRVALERTGKIRQNQLAADSVATLMHGETEMAKKGKEFCEVR
jgi:hypothetical protein